MCFLLPGLSRSVTHLGAGGVGRSEPGLCLAGSQA